MIGGYLILSFAYACLNENLSNEEGGDLVLNFRNGVEQFLKVLFTTQMEINGN